MGCRVLADSRHPRVLRPRFLPKVVEALHLLLLLSAHFLVGASMKQQVVVVVVIVGPKPNVDAAAAMCCTPKIADAMTTRARRD